MLRLLKDDPTPQDVSAVDRAITQQKRRQSNLIANLAELAPASAELVRRELKNLAERLQALEAERQELFERQKRWHEYRERLSDLRDSCVRVGQNVEQLTYEEKRLALDAYNVKAKVWPNGHEPRYEVTCEPIVELSASASSAPSAA